MHKDKKDRQRVRKSERKIDRQKKTNRQTQVAIVLYYKHVQIFLSLNTFVILFTVEDKHKFIVHCFIP